MPGGIWQISSDEGKLTLTRADVEQRKEQLQSEGNVMKELFT